MSAKLNRIWSLQYLRAAAAVAVIVYHQFQGSAWLLAAGEHGVDLFFVISGFIMVAMTQGRSITAGRFVVDRLTRIVPPYWCATLLAFAAVSAGFPMFAVSNRLDLLARSLLFVPSYNTIGKIWPTMFLGWTLNYEMFFYMLFAASLYLPARSRMWAMAGLLVSLVFLGHTLAGTSAAWIVYTSPLLLEFLAGIFMGAIFGSDLRANGAAAQLGLAAAVVGALAISSAGLPSTGAAWVATAIVGAALLAERHGIVPRVRWVAYIGDASFALYIFQQFGFELANAIYELAKRESGFLHAHAGLRHYLAVSLAIVFGLLGHRWIEKPLTHLVRVIVLPGGRTHTQSAN